MLCSMWNLTPLTREKAQISTPLPKSCSSRDQLGFKSHFHFQKWHSHTSRTSRRNTTAAGSTRRKGLLWQGPPPLTCHFTSVLGPGFFCVCPWFSPSRLSPCSPHQSFLKVCPLKPRFQHPAPVHTVDVGLGRAERWYQLSVQGSLCSADYRPSAACSSEPLKLFFCHGFSPNERKGFPR